MTTMIGLISLDCKNAEKWEEGGVYRDVGRLSSVLFMLLVLYSVFLHFFFLSPFILDFFTTPPPLLVSLSRTFIKGALLMVETVVGLPERLPSLHSPLPRVSLCFAAHSF